MSITYIPEICLKPKTTAENTTQIALKTIGQKCSIWLAPMPPTLPAPPLPLFFD